jgi:Flp pilus assembly protein TadD
LGRLYSKQGKNDEAEKVLKEILEIDRNNVPSRTELGRLFAKQSGRELEAEQYFRDAIRLDKNQVHARNELAILLTNRGDIEEAEKTYRQILKIKPGDKLAIRALENLVRKKR